MCRGEAVGQPVVSRNRSRERLATTAPLLQQFALLQRKKNRPLPDGNEPSYISDPGSKLLWAVFLAWRHEWAASRQPAWPLDSLPAAGSSEHPASPLGSPTLARSG